MRVDTCVGTCYGAMHRDVIVKFVEDNKHAFEVIPISRKRKLCLEFDREGANASQAPEEHHRAF